MTSYFRFSFPAAWRLAVTTIALAAVAAACQSKPAAKPVSASAWAVVNDHEITADDVDKAWRRSNQGGQTLAEDEVFAGKLALLDDLISQEIFLARARELAIDVPQTELDSAMGEARKNIPEETFKQELARRTLTEADVREGLRREMLINKLFEREVSSKVTVTSTVAPACSGAISPINMR